MKLTRPLLDQLAGMSTRMLRVPSPFNEDNAPQSATMATRMANQLRQREHPGETLEQTFRHLWESPTATLLGNAYWLLRSDIAVGETSRWEAP